MVRVRLNTPAIVDRQSFHRVFRELMGFPDFYGANMEAWVDCMSDISRPDNPEGGMTRIVVAQGESLVIEIPETASFWERVPDIARDLVMCIAFVNQRAQANGDTSTIMLYFT
jgi:hypothetical protein